MNVPLASVLMFALLPAAAALLGAGIAAFWRPGSALRSSIQHFAAGLLFAAIGTELLPGIMHERAPLAAVLGFTLGIGLMLCIKYFTERSGQRGAGKSRSLLVTLAVDVVIDGLLVGMSFAAGAKQGILLTFALTVEVLFLGLSSGVALAKDGTPRARIVQVGALLAILLMIGAGVGAAFLKDLTGAALEAALSFGSAALLYLVTEELLVEAHAEPETPLLTAMFFVGFLVLLVAEMTGAVPAATSSGVGSVLTVG